METSLGKPAARSTRTPLRILLPAGDSPFAVAAAQCLKRALPGLHISAGFCDRNPIGRWSRFIDRMLPLDRADPAAALLDQVRRGGFDLVLPVSGPGIELVAAHAQALRAHVAVALHPGMSSIELCNDKWAFAQALQRWGVPAPATVLLESAASLDAFNPAAPLIVKPRRGSGGAGIVRYPHRAALLAALPRHLQPGQEHIVQAWIDGVDIDRSLLVEEGEVFAGAVQQPLRQREDFAPSLALRFLHDPGVDAVTDRLVAAMGYSGVVHIDLRRPRSGGEPLVIEANPRYWATMLGALCAGVNFPALHVRRSLGERCIGPAVQPATVTIGWRAALQAAMQRAPAARGTLGFVLADPLPRLMTRWHASTALGLGRA